MKLLTKEIERRMPRMGDEVHKRNPDPLARVKFFDPSGLWRWYGCEGTRTPDGDYRFFGLVCGYERELGYFLLSELQHAKDGIKGLQGLPIERDLYFKPKPLSECE